MRRTAARLLVLLAGVVAVLALGGPAVAHVGGDVAGSDFDGRVTSVTPEVPGLTVRVLQFGDEFEVVNTTGTEVEIPGYSDEPYLRIGPDGVWRNSRSPATYLNLDRFGGADVPETVDVDAEPEWVQVSTQPQYVWHDHRTHWMSEDQLPPAVAADPDREHLVATWVVPMSHGGTDIEVAGELTWEPPPSPWVVWPAHLAVAGVALAAGLVARDARPLGGLLVLGGAAALVHALTTPEPPASIASHGGAIASALLPALAAVAVAALGARAAWRGRGAMAGLFAVVLGWLLLVQGLPDVDVMWSANVLATGPDALARVVVALLLGLGAGLVGGGTAAVRRFRESGARTEAAGIR
ncbi:hypothetical protein [Blastococcus sp. TF02A-26]|uniref:hypothetical protein n=1 Tax=Blastococcus sp. TF02A-26 TaxID=2250577 RepID=UPI000DEA53F6|nr:hypothetical protein [Blastococcus sp. TF02A-26]RBY86974.1 hypothetical protein DQ240_09320 [Blastococcus sp. TF02A-26]